MVRKTKKKPSLITFKVTPAEKEALAEKARKYCKGNVSRWLRLAGVHFTPTKRELALD